MDFIDIMQTYFRGEKLEATFYILPVGLLLIGLAVTAVRAEHGGFAWAIAVPCALVGLTLIGVGATVATRTDAQVASIEQSFHENPQVLAREERDRIAKVNANFRLTYFAFGLVAAFGIVIHYLGGMDWGRGLGAALILIGDIGLLIDGFAERRAELYTQALDALSAKASPPVD